LATTVAILVRCLLLSEGLDSPERGPGRVGVLLVTLLTPASVVCDSTGRLLFIGRSDKWLNAWVTSEVETRKGRRRYGRQA